jgi:transcriptional regulator with XRE-family HTH domain
MEERGLSLQHVADLAGVSKSIAHGWVNGTVPRDLPAVARLAKALGVSFKSLLLGEPEDIMHAQSLAELYDESLFFEGLCRISIKKLSPRKKRDRE